MPRRALSTDAFDRLPRLSLPRSAQERAQAAISQDQCGGTGSRPVVRPLCVTKFPATLLRDFRPCGRSLDGGQRRHSIEACRVSAAVFAEERWGSGSIADSTAPTEPAADRASRPSPRTVFTDALVQLVEALPCGPLDGVPQAMTAKIAKGLGLDTDLNNIVVEGAGGVGKKANGLCRSRLKSVFAHGGGFSSV